MIGYVKSIPGRQRGGFLALRVVRGNTCVPITGEVEQSRDDAVFTCIQYLCGHLEDLLTRMRDEFTMVQANMARLLDRVQRSDQVRIAGVWQTPDDDGLVMPRRRSRARFPGRRDRESVTIDAVLFATLHAVLDLRGTSEDPAELMLDLACRSPAELLSRVAAREPERLADAAWFVVQVFRAQREPPSDPLPSCAPP